MAVLYQFVLLFHGSFAFSFLAPHTPHTVNVHTKTKDNKAKHDEEEGFGVLVGKDF